MTGKPRIAVLVPAYNEEDNIRETLETIASQSLRPSIILVGDNESTDNTAREAEKALKNTGIEHYIIRVKRYPWLGKLNINNVYYALTKALNKLGKPIDYVATIEADVRLEQRYFEKLAARHQKDPRLCITGGRLEPLGLPRDPFPLAKPLHLWGGNRLYKAKCWNHLNKTIDIRLLPAWDTDHVILALILGYHVQQAPEAKSWTRRSIRPFHGYPKGWVDAQHGLPAWWALYKTLEYSIRYGPDPGYLAGYISAKINRARGSKYLEGIRRIYRQATPRILAEKLVRKVITRP